MGLPFDSPPSPLPTSPPSPPPPPRFFPLGILRLIGSACVSSVGPSLSVSADERMRAVHRWPPGCWLPFLMSFRILDGEGGGIWGRNLRRVRLTSSRQESESSRVLSKQRHRSDAAVALFSRPWRKLFGLLCYLHLRLLFLELLPHLPLRLPSSPRPLCRCVLNVVK